MTDLEICKRIAEIEDRLFNIESSPSGKYIHDIGEDIAYDPLTDKALCFDLMVKYNIELTPVLSGCWCATVANKYTFDEQVDYKLCLSWLDENPQKAICLAIINKDNKQ